MTNFFLESQYPELLMQTNLQRVKFYPTDKISTYLPLFIVITYNICNKNLHFSVCFDIVSINLFLRFFEIKFKIELPLVERQLLNEFTFV